MSDSSTARVIAIAALTLIGSVIAAAVSPTTVYIRREPTDYDYEYGSRLSSLQRRIHILRERINYRSNMWVRSAQSAVDRYEITRNLRDLKRAMSEVESAEFFIR